MNNTYCLTATEIKRDLTFGERLKAAKEEIATDIKQLSAPQLREQMRRMGVHTTAALITNLALIQLNSEI